MDEPWRHEHVVANGLRFHYVTAGWGPLVLLLHGFPQFWYSWRRQLPALAARFRVVAPDLRGYGGTDKPQGAAAYRLEALADDTAALVRALGEERAAIVGHDWGGGAAWATALLRPEVVERLAVLNCPHPAVFLRALRSNPRQLLRSWYIGFFQLPWLAERSMRGRVGELIASSARPGAFTAEDRRRFTEAFDADGVATAALNYYRAALRFPSSVRAATSGAPIAAPTLLVWGDRDQALGPELAEGMEPLFKGPLEVRHLPQASHWVHEEEPEAVNRLLLDFLA